MGGFVNAQFYSPMGLRGDSLVTLFFFLRFFITNNSSLRSCIRSFGVLVLLSTSITVAASSQVLFHESFHQTPDSITWAGTLDFFSVYEDSDRSGLQLNAPAGASSAQIVTRRAFNPVVWEWELRQDFVSSDNNRSFIFLNASDYEPESPKTGIVLQAGESGSHKPFRLLYLNKDSSVLPLIETKLMVEDGPFYRFRVVRCPADSLHLMIGTETDPTPIHRGSVSIEKLAPISPGHFGLRSDFTSSRNRHFTYGPIQLLSDIPIPEIADVSIQTNNPDQEPKHLFLTLTFTYPIAKDQLQLMLQKGTTEWQPVTMLCPHPQKCTFVFEEELETGRYNLQIQPFCSTLNSCSSDQNLILTLTENAKPGDIIINELLYRSDGLSHVRFVELWNVSDKIIDLNVLRFGR
ncbi:hypothetical protein QLX67_04295, partial [Balneolaceae bacterium ANBcel3]|nr:hypothetical protein [Balneolaceae bacterium ANBcel3]